MTNPKLYLASRQDVEAICKGPFASSAEQPKTPAPPVPLTPAPSYPFYAAVPHTLAPLQPLCTPASHEQKQMQAPASKQKGRRCATKSQLFDAAEGCMWAFVQSTLAALCHCQPTLSQQWQPSISQHSQSAQSFNPPSSPLSLECSSQQGHTRVGGRTDRHASQASRRCVPSVYTHVYPNLHRHPCAPAGCTSGTSV